MRYHVNSPLVAVRLHATADQRTIFTIPEGITITVSDGPDDCGLVQTTFKGELVAVFQRDLDDRASVVGLKVTVR